MSRLGRPMCKPGNADRCWRFWKPDTWLRCEDNSCAKNRPFSMRQVCDSFGRRACLPRTEKMPPEVVGPSCPFSHHFRQGKGVS